MVAEAGLLVFSTVGGVPELQMKERKKECKIDEYVGVFLQSYPDTQESESRQILYPDISGHDDVVGVVVVGAVVIGDETVGVDDDDDDDDGKTQDPVPVENSVQDTNHKFKMKNKQ